MNRGVAAFAAVVALATGVMVAPSRADDDASSKPANASADNATGAADAATQPATRRAKRNGATQLADAATTRATSGPVAATLPGEFAIFQTRNGFARGQGKPGKGGAAGGPEATFALKGIADVGSRLTAFFEDTKSKNVLQVAAGESIARGKVKKLDLD